MVCGTASPLLWDISPYPFSGNRRKARRFHPHAGIPGQPVKQCFRRRICSFHAGSGTGDLSGSGDHYADRQCTVPAHELCPGTEVLSRHSLFHRLIIAYDVTDELFGITIARPGILNPYYTYGAILLAAPAWAGGTACGIIAGNALPLRAVSALSVALYGMFLAIIIPPARKSKIVAALVAISFALSFVCNYLPGVSSLSEGTRTILLTVIISGAAAILFPVKQADEIIDKPVDKGRESVADNSAECTGKGGLTNE